MLRAVCVESNVNNIATFYGKLCYGLLYLGARKGVAAMCVSNTCYQEEWESNVEYYIFCLGTGAK